VISGGTATFVSAGMLYTFTHFLGLWYVISSVVSFLIGAFVSFLLQKFWTFYNHSLDKLHKQAWLYLLIMLANLALNTVLVFLLTDYLHIFYVASQIVTSIILASISFFAYRKLFVRDDLANATRRL
jgi:putative flippase GtrA